MDYIGDRISIKKKEEELSIVILSTTENGKKKWLLGWFILWTLSGIVVITQYRTFNDQDTRAAIIVWMGFWAYFEYKIFRVLMWRYYGMEKIKLMSDKIFYKRDVRGKGKVRVFQYDFIKDLHVVEAKEGFMEDLNTSFWVMAGEKIAFDYYGRDIKMGLQLSDEDAKALYKIINKKIS
jgi:hypothetical protein